MDTPEVLLTMPLHTISEAHGEEGLRTRFAELVRAVTNPPRQPGVDRLEQYREHLAHSLAANPAILDT
jgi:hypothetical protein